ncbi:universal stress protein [Hymenobacter convexus]|uniref:universal stress protein n=1 Tax=Hymenobacter sp. CA1UV-4 TaxID=3063782 RepID=UPI0027143E7B|nr:universal stress protein [Hymenobacter sp. CA1UV-4]MDO7850428.1 universal stress protein [Hymenobacter sp. CA1UV-4]
MKTILVPLDLTAAAEPTLAYANKLAVRWPAEVVLLHCLPGASADAPATLAAEEQRLRSLVERLRYQQLTRQDGRRIRYRYRVLAGTLPEHVQAEAVRCAADLVVMSLEHIDCCHQATPSTHAASVAEGLACPVLVVPPGRRSLPRRVVFSAEFGLLDKSVLRRLSGLAGAFPAPLELVQFYAPLDRPQRRPLKQALTAAATQLAWAAPVTQHLVEDESRLEGVDEFCAREHADLLIIAPTNAGQLVEYFASCYAKTRAYHTQIPVLMLRALGYNAAKEACCARCAQHPEPQQAASVRSVYHTIPWV